MDVIVRVLAGAVVAVGAIGYWAYLDYQERQRQTERAYRRTPRTCEDPSPKPKQEKSGSKDGGYNDKCPICMEVMSDRHKVVLDCDHCMHTKCAFLLARRQNGPLVCPICRKPIRLDD